MSSRPNQDETPPCVLQGLSGGYVTATEAYDCYMELTHGLVEGQGDMGTQAA